MEVLPVLGLYNEDGKEIKEVTVYTKKFLQLCYAKRQRTFELR